MPTSSGDVHDLLFGSLFAGIGGLELGLEWSGIGRTVWQVESDPWCRSVLARHWPDAERYDDVCTVGAANLARVDLICGGFPCQDVSYAGSRGGLDSDRSGLWTEYARIVRELRPEWVVVENVPGLLTLGFGRVLGDLAEAGFDAWWFCLRASDVGAPHRRERLFVVAHSDSVGQQAGWPNGNVDDAAPRERGVDPRHLQATTLASLSNLADADGGRREGERGGGILDGERPSLRCHADGRDGANVADSASERREGRRASASEGRARSLVGGRGRIATTTEPGMGGGAHGLPARVDRWPSGPTEPQHEWEPPRTVEAAHQRAKRLRGLGNAVCPQQAQVVGEVIRMLGGYDGRHA